MSVITPDLQAIRKQNERRLLFDRLRRYRFIYLMMIPVLVYFLVFSYYPMTMGIYSSLREIKMLGNASFVG